MCYVDGFLFYTYSVKAKTWILSGSRALVGENECAIINLNKYLKTNSSPWSLKPLDMTDIRRTHYIFKITRIRLFCFFFVFLAKCIQLANRIKCYFSDNFSNEGNI